MSSQKIVLVSSDGETFEVEEAVARKLQIVGHMIDDDCAHKPIPLQNVTGKILAMVVEYCKTHVNDVDDAAADDKEESEEDKKKKKADAASASGDDTDKKLEVEAFDKGFLQDLDLETIFQIILAANYLNVKGLLDLTCQNVADHIKDMSVEQVREIFGIQNDFTEEEEKSIRAENAWAFEDAAQADPKP
ncbi:hypothetical protein CARUB_v10018457mg [Capsella rubella]|uniref:SKP1-like protein n=1 Tax=Capsella rubella TaxID=81985 RepID=R0FRE2_9BRAS|nr:SKP1-like protein 14 [Capsella rubella]EOA25147.1 hypothetical protein CARUB_v10018457mg [Capsella rubella]